MHKFRFVAKRKLIATEWKLLMHYTVHIPSGQTVIVVVVAGIVIAFIGEDDTLKGIVIVKAWYMPRVVCY
jgi:hypothetical protein